MKQQNGKQTNPENYFIAGKKIGVTECVRDLDFLSSSDGTWHEQVNSGASKSIEISLFKSKCPCITLA